MSYCRYAFEGYMAAESERMVECPYPKLIGLEAFKLEVFDRGNDFRTGYLLENSFTE